MTTSNIGSIDEVKAELADLSSAVGSFLEHVHPLASARDLTGEEPFDRAAWARLAGELDLLGVRVDPRYGGQGLSFAYGALVVEELGRRLVPSPYLASVCLATEVISRLASQEQRARWLPDLVDGRVIATCALVSDPVGAGMRATPAEGHFILDGAASFVLYGAESDQILVPAELDGRIVVFSVDGAADGLTRSPMATIDRTRRQARLELRGCVGELLGPSSAAAAVSALDVLLRVRLELFALVASEAVGAAESGLAGAIAYVKERQQFGQPVGGFQTVQHELADLHGELESARAAVDHVVHLLDRQTVTDPRLEASVSVAALRSAEAFERVARQGLHLHGGIGFTWEHTSHLFLKRSLGDRSLLASRGHHRGQIARELFGSGPAVLA